MDEPWLAAQAQAEPKKPIERGIVFVTIVALGWAAVDVFLFSQGFISLVLCLVGLFYLLPRAFGAVGDPARFRLRMSKALATVGAGAAAFGIIYYGNQVAEERAHRIVAAVEAFQGRNGRYPARLEELVPAFLPEVPLAKPFGMARNFRYWKGDSKHTLMYTIMPPFGRSLYTFEDRKWSTLD